MRLGVSIDVEDWYMGLDLPGTSWDNREKRLRMGLDQILSILEERRVRGTFFILGAVAEMHPEAVRAIADAGHEIASHGYSHTMVYRLSPDDFRSEVVRTDRLLANITGTKPVGFRAPYFSITDKSIWALDILAENGYRYDASIYPGYNYRYGIPGSPDTIHRLPESGLVEIPVSVMEIMGRRIGIGGAYFRLLPFWMTLRGIRRRDAADKGSILYLHPWEFDPRHPRVKLPTLPRITHYTHLSRTAPRFQKLLSLCDAASLGELVDAFEKGESS
ncbi:MAG: DUF3473 domain-containing protein [Deltaproteobacteria bacterium]|nr:DUF3473 domain-containing protein [Candidatus Zymogenaceae bacterium]